MTYFNLSIKHILEYFCLNLSFGPDIINVQKDKWFQDGQG